MKIQTTATIEATAEELRLLFKIHGGLSHNDLLRIGCTETECETASEIFEAMRLSLEINK